jgi:hypothetical protein
METDVVFRNETDDVVIKASSSGLIWKQTPPENRLRLKGTQIVCYSNRISVAAAWSGALRIPPVAALVAIAA